jgi:uncharacterized membrane protein
METTDLIGIPIPSTDPVFIAFVVVHILISLFAVITGLIAMFAEKGKAVHNTTGSLYYWSMLSAFVTVIVLSVMRWPHNIHLLMIGSVAIVFTYAGRRLVINKPRNWIRLHVICMGASYILLLTGFYVDNGKNLPFWRMFPQWFFYVFPSLVGIPIIGRVLLTHALTRRSGKGTSGHQ